MVDAISHAIAQLGYIGIFLIMFIETIFPPIPSELVLPFAGYAAFRGELSVAGVVIAGTMGSLTGAACFYILGRSLKEHKLQALIARYGKWFGLKERDVAKSQRWFEKHGLVAVFFARLLPGMRSLISVPAGLHRIKPLPFFLLSLLGSAAWTLILVLGGYLLGDQYYLIADQVKPLSYIVLGLLVSGIVYFLWRRLGGYNKKEL
jgi:membrane protein DedA with SNARE-associated domain